MDTNTKGEKIYFDANFLIYWFISKEPELKKRARSLLAEFLINNDVFEKLSQFTKLILPKLNLAQFADIKNGVENALDSIKNFNLKPRDAFHLAIMKDNGIKIIVTDDEDFIGNKALMGISVQSIM